MRRSTKKFVFLLGFINLFRIYIRVCFHLVVFVREHNGALMRPLFFFECVNLSLLYPSLVFDVSYVFVIVCVCVCVCVEVVSDFTYRYFFSQFVSSVYLEIFCVCL